MNRSFSFFILLSTAVLFHFVSPSHLPAQSLKESLQNSLNTIQKGTGVYGLSAAVYLEGEHYWEGSAGYSNPFTADTITADMTGAIGSNTKMFTSSIILQLQEENKLDIDTTIDAWITPSDKIDSTITVRQLLGHTSGIADYTTDIWEDSMQVNPNRVWTNQELIDTFVTEPDFAPGTSWNYSNTGFLLLGEIIEQIEGKSYREVLYERILTPMNLTTMYTPIEDEPTAEEITPWYDIDNDGEPDNMFDYGLMTMHTSGGSAGYLYSTPADLAKFGYQLFSGQIISEQSLAEMTNFASTGFEGYEYGLGLSVLKDTEVDLLGHNGQYVGYTSIMLYEPESKSTLAIITNSTEAPINDIGIIFARELLDQLPTHNETAPTQISEVRLHQNYPNPFNPRTVITYQLPERSNVKLMVFNLLGRKIDTLTDTQLPAGEHSVSFDGSGLSSGVYYYQLETDSGVITETMTLIK